MELIQQLKWRYATKKMDPTKIVPQDKVERILEAIRLAPTSSGLQPYEIILVTNLEFREKIKAIAHGQGLAGQLEESSPYPGKVCYRDQITA